MTRLRWPIAVALAALLASVAGAALAEAEMTGYLELEGRYFPDDPFDPRQFEGTNASIAGEWEIYEDWDDGRQGMTFKMFARLDEHDANRSHADIRELIYRRSADTWELHAGVGKVYWGVTELVHLVDLINQTDLVENFDGEQKLGQPMLWLTFIRDYGDFHFFLLPGFRERTFPDVEGRPRFAIPVSPDQVLYESSAAEKHVDFAFRYSHYFGDFDIGLSFFRGTGRDPRFIPADDPVLGPVLIPLYQQIWQASLDLQATKGDWLWKLELITRDEPVPFGQFTAVTGGFERTLVGVGGSDADLGILAEYSWDERGELFAAFQNDLFGGVRLALNDAQSTELLVGASYDTENGSVFWNVEGNRRIGNSWTLGLQARIFSGAKPPDRLILFEQESYVEVSLTRFF